MKSDLTLHKCRICGAMLENIGNGKAYCSFCKTTYSSENSSASAELEEARKQEEENIKKAEELKKLEEETAKKAEELKRLEAENAKRAEELKRLEAENSKRAEELKRLETENAKKTEELKRLEEARRIRETEEKILEELREQEEELARKAEELKKRQYGNESRTEDAVISSRTAPVSRKNDTLDLSSRTAPVSKKSDTLDLIVGLLIIGFPIIIAALIPFACAFGWPWAFCKWFFGIAGGLGIGIVIFIAEVYDRNMLANLLIVLWSTVSFIILLLLSDTYTVMFVCFSVFEIISGIFGALATCDDKKISHRLYIAVTVISIALLTVGLIIV